MDYSDALRLMKASAAMRRAEWRPNKWIAQVNRVGSLPYLQIHITDGRAAPYTPSACDQYGDDWIDASDIARNMKPRRWTEGDEFEEQRRRRR